MWKKAGFTHDGGFCSYDVHYVERSGSSGFLVDDVASLASVSARVVFGCAGKEVGMLKEQLADGVIGMAPTSTSVLSQLYEQDAIGDVAFSICLAGWREGGGSLLVGSAVPERAKESMRYTAMATDASTTVVYRAHVRAITFGDVDIDGVDRRIQSTAGGDMAILDSGTTFSYLPRPMYASVLRVVENYAKQRGYTSVAGDPLYDDHCFEISSSDVSIENAFPSMTLEFPEFSLTTASENYMWRHSENRRALCLGFFDNGKAGMLLGAITLRNVLVQFNNSRRSIGLANFPCASFAGQTEAQMPFGTMERTKHSGYGDGVLVASITLVVLGCFVVVRYLMRMRTKKRGSRMLLAPADDDL